MQRTACNTRYLAMIAFVAIVGLFLVACGSGGGGAKDAPSTSSTSSAPAITSANSAVFTEGNASSFTVTTSGNPVPSLAEAQSSGSVSVKFVDNANGTATISATPSTTGVDVFTITATNSAGSATQSFTLTVASPDDDITPITNGVTLATANSHWVLGDQCEVSGVISPITYGLQLELTSGDAGFKAVFTDPLGGTHTSLGTWAANGGSESTPLLNALLVTTTSVANPGKYAWSWTISNLSAVAGSTSSSQFAAWVNWYDGRNADLITSPGLPSLTTEGCSFTLASGAL